MVLIVYSREVAEKFRRISKHYNIKTILKKMYFEYRLGENKT
jgi:hypothetical protein